MAEISLHMLTTQKTAGLTACGRGAPVPGLHVACWGFFHAFRPGAFFHHELRLVQGKESPPQKRLPPEGNGPSSPESAHGGTHPEGSAPKRRRYTDPGCGKSAPGIVG